MMHVSVCLMCIITGFDIENCIASHFKKEQQHMLLMHNEMRFYVLSLISIVKASGEKCITVIMQKRWYCRRVPIK